MPARKLITMFDRERTLAEWREELRSPVPASVVRQRLGRGWDPFEAITRPFDRIATKAVLTTQREQMRLALAEDMIAAFGKVLSVKQWARERGLQVWTLRTRLSRGIERGDSFESILALPRQPQRFETPGSIARRNRRPVPISIPPGPVLWAFVVEVDWPNPRKPLVIALRQVTGHRRLRRLGLSFARHELGEDCVAIGVVPPAVLAWRSRANPLHWLTVKPFEHRMLRWSHELAANCSPPGTAWKRGRRKGQFKPS